jgi:hypothetical protein
LPIWAVAYPASRNISAIVTSSGGNAPLPPCCEAQFPGTPARTGQRPVNIPARDGEQTGAAE